MTLPTVTVSISAAKIVGTPLAGGRVRFQLTKADRTGGFIVAPEAVGVTLDALGVGSVALWSNALGTQGSQYRVEVFNARGSLMLSALATVPATGCNLHDILNLQAPAVVDDAQAAALAAQYWASQAAAFAGLSGLTFDGGAPNSTYTSPVSIDAGTP